MRAATTLPLLFSELEKSKSWQQVDVVSSIDGRLGKSKIVSNGPFLQFIPHGRHSFFIFVANYTPMMDAKTVSVVLVNLDFAKNKYTLKFDNAQEMNEFVQFFFESMQRLEQFIANADILDYGVTERFQGIIPKVSKPCEMIWVLQATGTLVTTLQAHIVKEGKVLPGLSHVLSGRSHVSPALEVPKVLKKEKNVYQRSIFVSTKDMNKNLTAYLLCPDEGTMMKWVLSIYMGCIYAQKHGAERAKRFSSTQLPSSALQESSKVSNIEVKDIEADNLTEISIKEAETENMDEIEEIKEIEEWEPIECIPDEIPDCQFLQELKSCDTNRLLTLCCFLFVNGIADKNEFAAAMSALGVVVAEGDFLGLVSQCVTELISKHEMANVLRLISSDKTWMKRFYKAGSLLSFPGVCDAVIDAISSIETCQVTDSLLASLSFDDERRYLRNLAFSYLTITEMKRTTVISSIITQLEDGMIYPGLRRTKGPWKLIKDCATLHLLSPDFVETFEWIEQSNVIDDKRMFASKMEELVNCGIQKRQICNWIKELSLCADQLEDLYQKDCTLRDSVRLSFVTDVISRRVYA